MAQLLHAPVVSPSPFPVQCAPIAMKIKQIAGFSLLPDANRRNIEDARFETTFSAQRYLERRFPHHSVRPRGERFDIANRDGSVVLLSFRRFL